ncbi:putative ferric reductase transmembrane component [Spathaspora sp. JA1]|nr:putative ferric reductase transmembrane component [Spathaspora sp. JA1]
MKVCALLSLFITSAALVSAVKSYSELNLALMACEGFISANMAVCVAGGKTNQDMDCYCNTDPGFGTMADCFIKGYNNDSSIIKSFSQQCNSTVGEFYSKYDKIHFTEFEMPAPKPAATGAKGGKGGKAGGGGGGGGGGGKGQQAAPELSKVPLALEYTKFVPYREAYQMTYNNYNLGFKYGAGLCGYWGIVVVIATISNLFSKLFPGALSGYLPTVYRKNVTLPATFQKKKASSYSYGPVAGLIPSRLESFYVFLFVFLTALLAGINIKHIENNPLNPIRQVEMGHLVADRCGIMTCFLIPLLFLFAGRNNFLQWLTGWSFSTCLMYHRWISRCAATLIMVHGISFSASDIAAGRYATRMAQEFMAWGVVACILAGFTLVQSLLYFRRKCYEVFLIIHIVFAVFFTVGAWFHLSDQGYGEFMYATVAVWALDRFIRLARLASFGVQKAEITLLADETLKIIVPKPNHWKTIPGGHAFVTFLRPTCFWQQHPFTFTTSHDSEGKIVFYVKVKNGITQKMYKHLRKCPGLTTTMNVIIEGPYGNPSNGRRAKDIVYIAGGNGIPGIYSECLDVATKSNSSQSIKLIWVIRHWKSLSWFIDELKKLESTKVQTTIYVTRPDITEGVEHILKCGSEKEKIEGEKSSDVSVVSYPASTMSTLKQELSHVTFIEGRPSMDSHVAEEVKQANGSLAFVTCGHPVMVDDLRYAVTQHMNDTTQRVDFYEQLQTWA